LPEALSIQEEISRESTTSSAPESGAPITTSLRQLGRILWSRRRFIAMIEGSLLLLCLLYCLLAPNQYEAAARVELRTAPASALNLESNEPMVSASILSAPLTHGNHGGGPAQ
jgi:uncharacterized protein involved in exopolysaccharide biosynthesis